MTLILTAGDWTTRSAYFAHLIQAGHLLGQFPQNATGETPATGIAASGLVAALDSEADVRMAADLANSMGLRWLAWDCVGGASVTAYRMGAAAVVGPGTSPADLVHAVAMFLTDPATERGLADAGESRSYEAAETVAVDVDSIVVVRSGVLAVRALHHGGTEVLMGLFGPGEVLLAHSADLCGVELAAHTEMDVFVRPLYDVALNGEYVRRTWQSQTYLTAWSAVQSKARVDHRVIGILTLLADRFGRDPDAGWTMIDLRLTHQHLADAACATRPTVSRVLRDLLPLGVVRFDGAGDERRIQIKVELARATMVRQTTDTASA